ncbi:MAG: alpha/beta fold hydrolase [Anaerolineae bacterium]
MSKVTMGQDEIFYLQKGGGEPSLLFLHGAGGTHRHWGKQTQGLRDASLVALDLPGHGRSKGKGRQSVEGYADLVAEFMATLDLEGPTVVGHSMGGAIALDLALRYGERLGGLVLVGTGARLRVMPSLLEGLRGEFESTVDLLCRYAYGPLASEEIVRLGREEMLAIGSEVLWGDFLACDRFDVMDRLGEVRLPTLVICGEEDQLTPLKYAQFLVDHIQGARLVAIPEAGHMVMLEKSQETTNAIAEFSSLASS